MAKKIVKSREKGQKSLATFFKGAKETDENVDGDVETAVDDAPANDTVVDKKAAPDVSNLPPISSIPAIFKDLVSRIPEMKGVAEKIQGRKLRVATMCSGTESPLLALELIQDSIESLYGIKFDIQHVFSCEIEPFKQAYIERNFSPPILFRDICELGGDEATTAYGSLARVPGDVDLLIAGTSCVDYSNLNNEKQDIDANGESGRTFRGMMSWVNKHKPPLVILENVCGAPWDKVADYFANKGYTASHLRVDTKNYYIPHTRTRVYLLAVNQRHSQLPDTWKDMVGKMQRPASTTLDQWLLPSDDHRIYQSRQKLVRESFGALDRRTGRTDWNRCESRHQRARLDEALGPKRPLTGWEEGGYCKLPDFAWGDWGVGQVERVWDLMDISLLRSAKKGVDPSFKTQVWNLSQNVDREIGSKRLGICPCLTPSMIPYITNRGGPMVGLEALSMQGLPIDKLLLTRESEDQLADLAGNAMSTTVVGVCMMTALVVGKKMIKTGSDQRTYEERAGKSSGNDADPDVMDVDDLPVSAKANIEGHISGEDLLFEKSLDLSATKEQQMSDLLSRAERSARLCECEGRSDMTQRVLNRCQDCDASSCVKCGGRPEHNFAPIDLAVHPRLPPSSFARELKSSLPMSLTISGITSELLEQLKQASANKIPDEKWGPWRDAVVRAASSEQRFIELKRQEIWVASFGSSVGSMELLLHPQQPEWRFFAKPDESEPANSEIRRLLNLPAGRLVCKGGLLSGTWDIALPQTTTVQIQIKGVGEPIPAWEARLGLLENYKDRVVFPRLQITVPEGSSACFDRVIAGTYTLFDKCGTANNALHKKDVDPNGSEATLPQLYLFLDPTRTGEPNDDPFVISMSKRRYQFGETRPIICKLDAKWRQSSITDADKSLDCVIPCIWVKAQTVSLQSASGQNAKFMVPTDTLTMRATGDACGSAQALLVCKVPLGDQVGSEWPRDNWVEVDKVHERLTFKVLAWLLERVKNVNDNLDSWKDINLPEQFCACSRCAPQAPAIRWVKVTDKRVRAIEDTAQAGAYERALKNRPTAFVTQLKFDTKTKTGTVRIGVNIPSLVHRAFSRLPSANRKENPRLSWRLNTDFTDPAKLHLPKFRLTSNRRDPEHAQPPHFKIPLRPEQSRSLGWMLKQESLESPPFIEEEIAEAILDHLGWRAQGRAQRPVKIRGGVLADEVGYGKTAITLGLIDSAAASVKKESPPSPALLEGKIRVKGTLVVVPPHLTRQWGSEIKKFSGNHFDVVIISTASNINSLTIQEVQDADIVVVASNLFHSGVYLANLEAFSAGGSLPSQDGRYFNARLQHVLSSLREQVTRLQNEGSQAVMEAILDGRKKDVAENLFVQKKRLKGARFREEANKADAEAEMNVVPSGRIVEVVVPRSNSLSGNESFATSASESEPWEGIAEETNDSDASELPQLRKRTGRKPLIISDEDSEDEVDMLPKRTTKTQKAKFRSKPVKNKKKGDTDYEQSSSEEDDVYENDVDDEEESANEDSEDDSFQKSKSSTKPKPKPKPNKKSSVVSASSSDVDMDVDTEPKPKAKPNAKKRKSEAADDEKPVKKQKLREETDPWKLKSKSVKDDWKKMQAPPLEMFHFERLVIDEYTYLEGKILSLVTKLTATRRWVLSGTPPIHDFASLKTIAAFLDIHLGVDDDGEGHSAQVKKRRREQTDVEKFHSFREVHSLEWHTHRHELGQTFLDQFVRQNIAEIDEIPSVEKIETIDLPAAERAIYLELEHHLRALDMTIKRGRKTESDREKRLAKALGDSSTAEEALLKRCSHFDLDVNDEENAMKACEVIVKERTKQLDECKQELVKKLTEALKAENKIGRTDDESLFREYVRVTRDEGVGDRDATVVALSLLREAGIDAPLEPITNKPIDTKAKNAKNKAKGKEVELSTKIKDLIWEHREQTHDIRRLTKELVGRVRSLRYFTVVRDLQKQAEVPPSVSCPACGRENLPMEEIGVLSSCGHTGCLACVNLCAEKEECVYAESGVCKAAARVLNIVKGDTLGVDDVARDGRGRHYGLKLEKVVDLIKKRLPKEDRVLVFVQFPDLMKKVAAAFTAHKIKFLEIRGSASQKSKNLEKFQNDSEEHVLLLTVTDESASGANLTSANHAIFLSPLLTTTQEIYDACETQAIGRLRRYGQTKLVHIWRFLSSATIDMEIFEQRTGRKLETGKLK